nr:DUF2169 domain-containing protein [uncultured Desulfobulbus sp.]
MKSIRPLQIGINQQTFEQSGRFYFVVSASLGLDLETNDALLEFDYLPSILQSVDSFCSLDMGKPKLHGEFLSTGNFCPQGGKQTRGGEVNIRLGPLNKRLLVFGPRRWERGLPTQPEYIHRVPIQYSYAFGGPGYVCNPEGMGFNDGMLPLLELPDDMIRAPGDTPEPAGFSPIGQTLPKRTCYQGTYNKNYLRDYFPGFPGDFNWEYFQCAPKDQRLDGFWRGDESYEIRNMHPDRPLITGDLPGFSVRCFIQHSKFDEMMDFTEIPLNLDTIWFFPEKLLCLQIWRGVIEVANEEANEVKSLLAAYENRGNQIRSTEYYRHAFERRATENDPLLHHLNTDDLIPPGTKCAMEIFQERALKEGGKKEFEKNLNKKVNTIQAMVSEKIEEIQNISEKQMENLNINNEEKFNIKDLLDKNINNEQETNKLNNRLEKIIPGITSGDIKKIELKKFSFDKIDQIMDEIDSFIKEKNNDTLNEIENIKYKINSESKKLSVDGLSELQEQARVQFQDAMNSINNIGVSAEQIDKLPRLSVAEILNNINKISPLIADASQHILGMKEAGVETGPIEEVEKQLHSILETQNYDIEKNLKKAEADFKGMYLMGAHFMKNGLPPHGDTIEVVKARFLRMFATMGNLSNLDWACIDLHGEILDGIDLSGCFLEQVDFSGASLKGANLSGAILARGILIDTNLTGANLEGANIGAAKAHRANFANANLKGAKLSRGDFTGADFSGANLEEIESLEIIINQAIFDHATMHQMKFIERTIKGTTFKGAQMETAVFYNCSLDEVDCSGATLPKSVWADCALEKVCFDGADISSNCFVATDEGKSTLKKLSLAGACLNRSTFMNLDMQFTNFSKATMEGALFNGSDLSGADLTNVNAKQAQFRKTNLNGAKLDNINLAEGSLAKAQLTNASFRGANLYAVDCLRCQVGKTDFTHANLESTLLENGVPQ